MGVVFDALNAAVMGKANLKQLAMLDEIGIGFIGDNNEIWYWRHEVNKEKAHAILMQAKGDGTYEGPVPEDEKALIGTANNLVMMAQDAWETGARGPKVEAIIRLHDTDFEENGIPDEEPEEKNPAEAEVTEFRPQDPPIRGAEEEIAPVATESEPVAVEEVPDRNMQNVTITESEIVPEEEILTEPIIAVDEPWEGYIGETQAQIIDALKYAVGANEEDVDQLLVDVFQFEEANKNRGGIRNAIAKLRDQRSMQSEEAESSQGDDQPRPEEAPAPETTQSEGTTPTEEAASIAASTAIDAGGTVEVEGSEGDGEKIEASGGEPESYAQTDTITEAIKPGHEDRGPEYEKQPPKENGEGTYTHIIREAEEEVRKQRLYEPPPVDDIDANLPANLNTLSDSQLRQMHGVYSIMGSRVSFLLAVEETKARACKEAADEIYRYLIVQTDKYDETGKPKTMTVLEAEVESDLRLREYRRNQHRHEAFAMSYRSERDSYYKIVEALSRQESMRHNEYERTKGR